MDQLWVACLLTCAAVTSAELTGTRLVVKEDSDVVLSCSTSGSLRDKAFDWKKDDNTDVFLYKGQEGGFPQNSQFKGRVVHFPEALDSGNASIKIIKATVNDTGNYTCEFPPSPVKSSLISLLVGVCPKPHIKIVDGNPDRDLWQCDVEGASPKPTVLWQDSSGTVLPALETKSESRDGRFYITIQANVTKTDTYSCVVTQKDLCHQVNSSTFVYIGACSEPRIKIVDGRPDRALLQCEVEGAHPKPTVRLQDSSGTVLPAQEKKSESRDGRFYITIQANVTKTDTYSCVVTPKETCRQHYASTLVYIAPQSESNVGVPPSVIVLSVAIVCLLIAAAIFFIKRWRQKVRVRGPRSSTSRSKAVL